VNVHVKHNNYDNNNFLYLNRIIHINTKTSSQCGPVIFTIFYKQ